jgi:hypothetical protein
MKEIEFALEYARRRKTIRLNRNKIQRRVSRAKYLSNLSSSDSFIIKEFILENIRSMNVMLSNEKTSTEGNISPSSTTIVNPENIDSSFSSNDFLNFDDIVRNEEIPNLPLHYYTSMDYFCFSKNLLSFIRKSNISKTHAQALIRLIQSGLPKPNSLPRTYSGILNLLSGKFICLFLLFLSRRNYQWISTNLVSYIRKKTLSGSKTFSNE